MFWVDPVFLNQLDEGSNLSLVSQINIFLSLDPVYTGVKPAHKADWIFNGAIVVQLYIKQWIQKTYCKNQLHMYRLDIGDKAFTNQRFYIILDKR